MPLRWSGHHVLSPPKFGIEPVPGQQYLVRSLLHHSSLIKHDDLIGMTGRLQTMGDHHHRATDHQTRQGPLDFELGLKID